jgi:DNA-binding NtrC family response regulator
MTAPEFAVLSLSESFGQLWPKLVASAGATLREATSATGLEGCCGVLVAAGGREDEAIPLVEELRARYPMEVGVVGVEVGFRLAVTLMQAGVSGYFALPDDLGMLRSWIAERVQQADARARGSDLTASRRQLYDFSRMLGKSPKLMSALERAAKVIPSGTATVLITGETGTGKELLARAMHYNGPRAAGPFVEINCTALPENLLEAELFGYEAGAFTDAKSPKAGLMETANGGTLFLDEIGDLSLQLQGKLLRVLEEKRVRRLGSVRDQELNIRIIAATHVNLAKAVQEKRFREDLYYRLSVVPLELPGLRERGDDILVLASHFLERFCGEYGWAPVALSPDARSVLLSHSWPGNIRELRNAIERAVLLGEGSLDPGDFFLGPAAEAPPSSALPFPARLDRIERAAARAMMQVCGGNKSEAAKSLGISRKRLYALLGREDE